MPVSTRASHLSFLTGGITVIASRSAGHNCNTSAMIASLGLRLTFALRLAPSVTVELFIYFTFRCLASPSTTCHVSFFFYGGSSSLLTTVIGSSQDSEQIAGPCSGAALALEDSGAASAVIIAATSPASSGAAGAAGVAGAAGTRSSANQPGHELHDPPAPPFRHNSRFPSSLIERLVLVQPLTRVGDVLVVARQRVDRLLDEVAAGDDIP